jgi:hypothetical protein
LTALTAASGRRRWAGAIGGCERHGIARTGFGTAIPNLGKLIVEIDTFAPGLLDVLMRAIAGDPEAIAKLGKITSCPPTDQAPTLQ